VRIEDDVLVRGEGGAGAAGPGPGPGASSGSAAGGRENSLKSADGPEVLSRGVPVGVREIEEFITEGREAAAAAAQGRGRPGPGPQPRG
jgi:hypothetical protein